MKRRDFIKTAGGSVLLGGSAATTVLSGCAPEQLPDPQQPPASSLPDFSAWTWVHGNRDYDPGEWRRRFARLRSAGLDAVLVGGGTPIWCRTQPTPKASSTTAGSGP